MSDNDSDSDRVATRRTPSRRLSSIPLTSSSTSAKSEGPVPLKQPELDQADPYADVVRACPCCTRHSLVWCVVSVLIVLTAFTLAATIYAIYYYLNPDHSHENQSLRDDREILRILRELQYNVTILMQTCS